VTCEITIPSDESKSFVKKEMVSGNTSFAVDLGVINLPFHPEVLIASSRVTTDEIAPNLELPEATA
jgi:hypothetical protein